MNWKRLWEAVKDEKVGDLAGKFKEYTEHVRDGADPIEAMHGHLCGPDCMHWATMDEERKARLRNAPWNRS